MADGLFDFTQIFRAPGARRPTPAAELLEPRLGVVVEPPIVLSRSAFPLALVTSGALHALLLAATLAPQEAHAVDSGFEAADGSDPPDRWGGDTFDVELLDGPTPDAVSFPPMPPAAPVAPPTGAAPVSWEEPATTSAPPAPSPPPATVGSARAEEPVAKDEPGPASADATSVHDTSPPAASAGTTPAAHGAPVAGEARAPGTAFGAQGPGGAIRQLGRAFTRALPAAALPKDGWLDLPAGTSSEVKVTLTVDASGQLLRPDFGEHQVPRYLTEVVRRAHLLLERGRFSIGGIPGAGSETFALTVEVRDERPDDDLFVEPSHIVQRGFDPPAPDAPGRAYFTFASGRRVEVHVALVP